MQHGRLKKVLAEIGMACLVSTLLLSGGACSRPADDERDAADKTGSRKEQGENSRVRKNTPEDGIGPATGIKIRGKSG